MALSMCCSSVHLLRLSCDWDCESGFVFPDAHGGKNKQTSVTAVTVEILDIGDTSFVNMVRGMSKKVLFEPGDTRQQWKGEAAASFV